jgi:hypothetical protein
MVVDRDVSLLIFVLKGIDIQESKVRIFMKRGKPEKYIGLAGEIRLFIKEQNLKNGQVLPSERKMAKL